MLKAKTNPNSVASLAREIALLWPKNVGPEDRLNILASMLCQPPAGESLSVNIADAGAAFFKGLDANFKSRLLQGADQFISLYKQRLLEQGLSRVSEAALRAFFFSALYEALRFDTILEEGVGAVIQSHGKPGGRRKRVKRRGAAYFTPPALAYLAASRALSAYFDGAKVRQNAETLPNNENGEKCRLPLPLICDPAMGTGLYLVAALDYLSVERPDLSRISLAGNCLFGVDFDAITCSAAKYCLALATGSAIDGVMAVAAGVTKVANLAEITGGTQASQLAGNLLWADALLAELPCFDIVLSNPPWDIVKAVRKAAGTRVPSRVNKAHSNTLRQAFRHQGEGDTSYYKLFLERIYQILKPGGVAAVLTPAALCCDKGAAQLRALLIDCCSWLSLDGFVNEDNAFAIHPHFKYLLLCFKKGLATQTIKTRFGLVAGKSRLADTVGGALAPLPVSSESVGGNYQFFYKRSLVKLLGGSSGAILEIEGKNDADLLTMFYQNHTSLKHFLDSQGNFFRREFDMTLDRHRFITVKRAANAKETYLPLFEGRMIGQFDAGKQAVQARYFVRASDYRRRVPEHCARVGFVSVSSAFNTRSMIATYLPDLPAGNSLPTVVFKPTQNGFLPALEEALYTTALFNSFVFDWLVRFRLAGNNLSYHLLEDLPFPPPGSLPPSLLELFVSLSALLSLNKGDFNTEILALGQAPLSLYQALFGAAVSARGPQAHIKDNAAKDSGFEVSDVNLLRFRIWLEVLVCEIYGLLPDQVAYILRDCHISAEVLRRRRRLNRDNTIRSFSEHQRARDCQPGQRSFFRVDKGLAPHLRLSNLVNAAFAAVKSEKIDFVQALFDNLSRSHLCLTLPAAVEQSLTERFAIREARAPDR